MARWRSLQIRQDKEAVQLILPRSRMALLSLCTPGEIRLDSCCRSSGSEDGPGDSINGGHSRMRLPQAAIGRMEAYVNAFKTTLNVHDFSAAMTYTVEKLAPYNAAGATEANQKNILVSMVQSESSIPILIV